MDALKRVGWAALAVPILWFLQVLVVEFVLFPFGGGEYHAIFAYSAEGGRLEVAGRVFAVYILVTLALCWLLILRRYPAHWLAIGLAGCAVCLWSWWGICSFRYEGEGFRAVAVLGLPLIPLPLLYGCLWAERCRRFLAARRNATIDSGSDTSGIMPL